MKRSPVLTLRDGSSIVRPSASATRRLSISAFTRLRVRAGQGSRERAVEPLARGAFVDSHDVAAGIVHGVFLASPAPAYAPLWLKVLVIVMGLLIVAGFVIIAAEIARRMSTPNAARSPAAAAGFSERIALPAGARVVSMTAAGDRLIVHVETQGGPAFAYVVDPRNGTLHGGIPPGIGR